MATSPASCGRPGVTHTGATSKLASPNPPIENHTMIASLLSPDAPSRRMLIIENAQAITPNSTTATGHNGSASAVPRHGRTMINTPASPASTAIARRHPTRSPRNGPHSTVSTSGIANPSAVLAASGRCA